SDGWSNINCESVQNFITCLPNPVFYDAIFFGETHHTGEWIATQIINKMKEIDIYKFSTVITDTVANMKAAWKIIEEKYPHIICLGCSSHVINLLIGDILKITEIKSIIEEIALVLSVITRWGTHFDCIKSLLESQTAIQQILFDQSTTTLEIQVKIQLHSDKFWNNLKIVFQILKPIVATLKAFESNSSTISTIYS
ncbi:14582_t:CDS:2, partial [Gigaspora margarita]